MAPSQPVYHNAFAQGTSLGPIRAIVRSGVAAGAAPVLSPKDKSV